MTTRQINNLRHNYSGRQSLAYLLDCWRADKHAPVLLIAHSGRAVELSKQIRVSLSKERMKNGKSKQHYGFTCSEPFPYTDGNERGEAIVIHWRITPTQNLLNNLVVD